MSRKNWIWDIVIAFIISPLCLLACDTLIFINVIPLCFAIFLGITYITAKRGFVFGLVSLVFCFAVLAFAKSKTVLIDAMLIVPAVLATAYFIRKNYPFYDAMLYSSIAVLVGIILVVIYSKIVSDCSIGEFTADTLINGVTFEPAGILFCYPVMIMAKNGMEVPSVEELNILAESIINNNLDSLKATLEQEENFSIISQLFDTIVPIIALYAVLILGVGVYVLARFMVKRSGRQVALLPDYSRFIYSKQNGIAFLIMLICGEIITLIGIESLEMFSLVLVNAMLILFAVEGVAFIYWIFKRYLSNGAAIALTVVISLLVGIGIGYLGMIEQFVRLRDKTENINPNT